LNLYHRENLKFPTDVYEMLYEMKVPSRVGEDIALLEVYGSQ